MKKLLIVLAVTTVSLTPLLHYAMAKEAGTLIEAAPEKIAGVPKPAPAPSAPTADEPKVIPMNSRADSIDTKGRFFITKRKDGVEVKNVLTEATEIKQGPADAKLEDIKVGDYVSGSRKKVSTTEYTVIKITKFGPRVSKKDSASKSTDKKPN